MSPRFFAFLVASLVIAITPGPGVIYILTQTLRQGRKAGLASVGGIAFGNLGNAVVASAGLAALFAASSVVFIVVKLAGSGYLIFLGIRALRTKATFEPTAPISVGSPERLFRDGLLVALLNPKTALFFAALLQQFMEPDAPPLRQSLVLGCTFVLIALCTDTAYVLTAAVAAAGLRRRLGWPRYGKYLSATSFFGLGGYAALASMRAAK